MPKKASLPFVVVKRNNLSGVFPAPRIALHSACLILLQLFLRLEGRITFSTPRISPHWMIVIHMRREKKVPCQIRVEAERTSKSPHIAHCVRIQ